MRDPVFDYTQIHSFSLVTENLLRYLSNTKVLFYLSSSYLRFMAVKCLKSKRKKSYLPSLKVKLKEQLKTLLLQPVLKINQQLLQRHRVSNHLKQIKHRIQRRAKVKELPKRRSTAKEKLMIQQRWVDLK